MKKQQRSVLQALGDGVPGAMPLSGLRILDLTRLLPGAFCTQMLAEFGAEVIKIEQPQVGDYWRDETPKLGGTGARYASLNRLKKSLTLDLKSPAGRQVFLAMVEQCDVVIEGFRPGVVHRLGIDWPTLRARNSRVVMVSLSGFGQEGPLSRIAAHDLNIVGLSGALDLAGPPDGEPAVPALPLGDIGGGSLMAVIAVFAALRQRDITGEGRYVDIAMLDGLIYWLQPAYFQSLARGAPPKRGADPLLGGAAWYRPYRTSCGGAMVVGAYEPKFWTTFCTVMGVPEFIDTQFGDAATQRSMMARLEAIFISRSRAQWSEVFDEVDCCVTPVLNLLEAVDSSQMKARGMKETDGSGNSGHISNPIRIAGVSAPPSTPPPALGEHSREVLRSFGFDDRQISDLEVAGVI